MHAAMSGILCTSFKMPKQESLLQWKYEVCHTCWWLSIWKSGVYICSDHLDRTWIFVNIQTPVDLGRGEASHYTFIVHSQVFVQYLINSTINVLTSKFRGISLLWVFHHSLTLALTQKSLGIGWLFPLEPTICCVIPKLEKELQRRFYGGATLMTQFCKAEASMFLKTSEP